MAIAPLKIAAPTVPLIGGQQLPKASGEGVRIADLSNAFAGLSATLMQQDAANRTIDDKILAATDAENYVSDWVGKNPDKNPLGAVTKLPTINGSPTYRAAALDSLEENTLTRLQTLATTDFAEIRTKTDKTTAEKTAMMRNKAAGYLEALAPAFKGRARAFLEREITQWSDSLVSQDYENQQAAIVNDVNNRIKLYTDQAFSAGAAGSDYTIYTQQAYKALDEKVRLSNGRILQADADRQKELIGRAVLAASSQHLIADGAFNGKVPAAELGRWATALDANADATLTVTEPPGPGDAIIAAGDREAPGPGKTEGPVQGSTKTFTTKQMREAIGDETLVGQMAADMKELASQLSQHDAEAEKRLHYIRFVQATDGVTPMPPTLNETQEKMFSEQIELGALKIGPNGQFMQPDQVETMIQSVLKTLVMPDVFTESLMAMAQGNTKEARAALTIWNRITEARDRTRETGAVIRNSVPNQKSALLNGYRDLMNRMVRIGAGEQEQEQAWRDMTIKLRDPKNSIDNLISQYGISVSGAKVEGNSFSADLQAAFLAHYNTMGSMPAIFQREVEAAYQIERIMGDTALSNYDVLQKVLDYQFKRFAASKAFKSGFALAGDLSTPKGYKRAEWLTGVIKEYGVPEGMVEAVRPPQDPDMWLNDYTMEQIEHHLWWNRVVLDPELKEDLERITAAGAELKLGKDVFLNPTNTGTEHTQFEVWVLGNDGGQHQLFVRDERGRAQPMLVDPGIVRSTMDARKAAADEADRFRSAGSDRLKTMINDEWSVSNPGDWMTGKSLVPDPVRDAATFKKWLETRPQEFQDRWKQGEKDFLGQLQKRLQLMDELDRQTFPGQEVSPAIQLQSRAEGENVMMSSAMAIERVFPDGIGGQGLVNLALVETDGGTNVRYSTEGDSGIWQVNTGANGSFLEVQRRARIPGTTVAIAAEKAKRVLGIDVLAQTPRDMEKPLVNALFARLTMMTDQHPVSADLNEQLRFYTTVYNPNATATMQENFLKKANRLLVSEAYAAAPSDTGTLDPGGPGLVTDVAGNAFPANFTATNRTTQLSALRLSAAFGKPLRITAHGGKSHRDSPTSQHPAGTALDIYVGDYTDEEKTQLIALAIQMGYRGIGGYAAGSGVDTIHLDLRRSPGRSENGLAIWWRHTPGVDSPWRTGAGWFRNGISRGLAMYGRNSA